jgi:molecular chaperone DnaK/molecular chaperone HscA
MMLGGDNLNMAIRDKIFSECRVKRHKLTDSIERQFIEIAEKLKLTVQKESYAKLDFPEFKDVFQKTTFVLNEETYMSLVDAVFKITIVLTHAAINKSGYKKEDIKLILVGGSTRDPYLIKLISQTINPEPLTYDPDRIVAQGAAYYAYLVHQGQNKTSVSDVTKAIGIELEGDGMEFIIRPNSKLPIIESCMVRNSEDTDILKINVRQGNSAVASRNDLIGTMNYRYSGKKKKGEGLVTVKIAVGVDGTIDVKVKEPMKKEECITLCQN